MLKGRRGQPVRVSWAPTRMLLFRNLSTEPPHWCAVSEILILSPGWTTSFSVCYDVQKVGWHCSSLNTRALRPYYHDYINLKSNLSEVSSPCSEIALCFGLFCRMSYKPVQPHYSMAVLVSGQGYCILLLSDLLVGWFGFWWYHYHVRNKVKGTLKWKLVKFNTRWMKGVPLWNQLVLIKGRSVNVIPRG